MVAQSLIRAFLSLLHPRMLALMVWPALVALALWIGLALAFWSRALAAVDALLRGTPVVQWMGEAAPLAVFASQLGWILLVLLFVPLVLVTATLIIGAFAMPAMVNHVAAKEFPRLARRRGGSAISGATGSAWNALVAMSWFALLAVATLPLWLLPPLWPALPVLLIGYLNYRMFAYEALLEHASPGELSLLLRQERAGWFALGMAVALAGYVPLFGLFAPVYGGLAFTHYGLARLEALRDGPIEGMARRIE
jgi:CysZ protein